MNRSQRVLKALVDAGRGLTFKEVADRLGGARGSWGFVLYRLEASGKLVRDDPPAWGSARVTEAGLAYIAKADGKPPRKPFVSRGGLAPDGGSRWQKEVRDPVDGDYLLKHGRDNKKLGYLVTKGRHAGRRLFSLTLEEGRSCPPCDLAKSCYGGNMHLARRWRHGPALEGMIRAEVDQLQSLKPLVRLHVLGDFYSIPYARMWAEELEVAVFGYTHHHPFTSLGRYLAGADWTRFSIRKSFDKTAGIGAVKRKGAVTIDTPDEAKAFDAIVCPVQTGAQASCATCGLCWNTEQNIAFLRH